MKKYLPLILILAFPALVQASDPFYTVSQLINDITLNPGIDGKYVILEGEVISEPLERKDGVWINLTDGSSSIGVFFRDKSQIANILYWGQHHFKGDFVRITGKVYLADKETNGELDVQGEKLRIMQSGYRIEEVIPVWKIILAVIFGLIALTLLFDRLIIYFRRRKAKKTNIIEGFFDYRNE
jgi:aspartyl/asparaginyl-tRNA synthetase